MATSFRRIIELAYQQILGRPSDPAGLAAWQSAMEGGMAEWAVREAFIRSAEYADKNPGAGPPPPPPPAGSMTPLRVVGNRFHNAAGPVDLLGTIICCTDDGPIDIALERGWPLVDNETLDLYAGYKLNYTDIRLGPSIDRERWGEGEFARHVGYFTMPDGRYDLDRWNDAFWESVREVLRHSESRGIYVLTSNIDSWILDHQLSPWSPERNIQGYSGGSLEVVKHAPSPIHERWIRKVARETGGFPNVIYLDGNESFKGHVETAWIHGIRDILRDELAAAGHPPRLFGSNSAITTEVDFQVSHGRDVPLSGAQPIIVDEYGTKTPAVVLQNIRTARARPGGGVYYMYWRGGHSWADSLSVMAEMRAMLEGGDGGGDPIPDDCPEVTRFGVSVLDFQFQGQVVPGPRVGGKAILNSTMKFGNPPHPCNQEHPGCGGRPCEDPRGGIFAIEEAPPGTELRVDENPYLAHVSTPAAGLYRIRVSARPDAHDGLGKPLVVAADSSRTVEWTA